MSLILIIMIMLALKTLIALVCWCIPTEITEFSLFLSQTLNISAFVLLMLINQYTCFGKSLILLHYWMDFLESPWTHSLRKYQQNHVIRGAIGNTLNLLLKALADKMICWEASSSSVPLIWARRFYPDKTKNWFDMLKDLSILQ